MVFDQHPGQPRRRGARRSGVVQNQGRVEARSAGAHLAARFVSRALREYFPQSPHQLLPAARRQQRRLGQHRYLRMARLSNADQSRFPVPRLDSGGADRARSGAFPRPRTAHARTAPPGNSGMAELLLQVADDGTGAVSGTRFVYPVDEAEEHAAALKGRGADYAFGAGILRLESACLVTGLWPVRVGAAIERVGSLSFHDLFIHLIRLFQPAPYLVVNIGL